MLPVGEYLYCILVMSGAAILLSSYKLLDAVDVLSRAPHPMQPATVRRKRLAATVELVLACAVVAFCAYMVAGGLGTAIEITIERYRDRLGTMSGLQK